MGTETRSYNATKRQLIDYNHLVNNLGEKTIVCIDKGILSVARVFLSTRGLWRSSYVTGYADNFYYIPNSAEFDQIDSAIADFLVETEMGLCEDLLTAIQDIPAAIRQTACCVSTGSSGAPSTSSPPSSFQDDLVASFPPQYNDRPTYENAKCNIAQGIINDLVEDINWLLTIDVTAVASTVFIATLLSPIPGDEILAFIGLLIGSAILGGLAATLSGLVSQITSNEDELRCALFLSTSVGGARQNFKDVLSLTGIQAQIINYMLGNDSLNRLFEYQNNAPQLGAACNCADAITVIYGTPNDIEANPFTMTWELYNLAWRVELNFSNPITFSWETVVGHVNAQFPSTGDFIIGSCTGSPDCSDYKKDIYTSDTQPVAGTVFSNVRRIAMTSNDGSPAPEPWTIQYTWD